MFVPGRPFQPSLMFENEVRRLFKGLRSGRLQPYSQKLDYAANIKSFITLGPGQKVRKLFTAEFTNFHNKLEFFSLAGLSSLVYCLWVRSRAYTRVEHMESVSLG